MREILGYIIWAAVLIFGWSALMDLVVYLY